jgi:hypothetical protein
MAKKKDPIDTKPEWELMITSYRNIYISINL